jgi:hypothetical protein
MNAANGESPQIVVLESLGPSQSKTIRTFDARLLELVLRSISESRADGKLTIEFRRGQPRGAVVLEQYA